MAWRARRKGGEVKAEVWAELDWRVRGCERSVLPVADSARFRRRMRVQGNGPRASRLRASGVKAVHEQCAGDATRRGDPVGAYAGVPAVFLQHTRVSSGGLACEQENPEVRGGVGIANQSGLIGFFHKSTTSSNSYLSLIAEQDHDTSKKLLNPYRASSDPFTETSSPWQSRLLSPRVTVRNIPPAIFHPLQFPDKLLHHPRNLVTVELFSSSILFAMKIHFPLVLLHN
jgi:hypothetical protein